jgi:hypothetical protein
MNNFLADLLGLINGVLAFVMPLKEAERPTMRLLCAY